MTKRVNSNLIICGNISFNHFMYLLPRLVSFETLNQIFVIISIHQLTQSGENFISLVSAMDLLKEVLSCICLRRAKDNIDRVTGKAIIRFLILERSILN